VGHCQVQITISWCSTQMGGADFLLDDGDRVSQGEQQTNLSDCHIASPFALDGTC